MEINVPLLLVLLHISLCVTFMCYKTNTKDVNKIIRLYNDSLLTSAALVFALTFILNNN